jgi:geranylgeranyl diphosphate synthase type I
MPSRTGTSGTRRASWKRSGPPPRARQAHAKAIAGNPFSALLATVKRDVDARLSGFLDAKLDLAQRHGRDVVEMVSALRGLCLRGGKRLRPALLVVGYRAADARADLEPALDASVAIELLQSYFLIHDDWMDSDPVRRGGPSVHVLLTQRFRSAQVGNASAILAGDYAVALAAEALARVEVGPGRMQRMLTCFAEMQLDAVAGQQLDILGRTSDVEHVYALKTSSYTVRGPLRLGALIAGASTRTLTALDRFALPAGIAFQLRDDLLSAFGEPAQTGKPFGGDLKAGKRTPLLLAALARARGADRKLLERTVGNRGARDADVRRAVLVLERCGARAEVEARTESLVEQALGALRAGRLTAEGRALLEGAAAALTARQQ